MKSLSTIRSNSIYRVTAFILKRALMIAATIFVGVTITIMVANQGGQVESVIERELHNQASRQFRDQTPNYFDLSPEERNARVDEIEAELRAGSGLDLPYLPRQMRFAINALSFDWGDVTFRQFRAQVPSSRDAASVKTIVMRALPNTLLLVGSANLLIFLIGLPLSISLSRQPGSRIDRIFSLLAPLSTFPSWVIGLVLVLIFAIQLHWLPAAGIGRIVPTDPWYQQATEWARYLLLPVSAIVVSLFFQFVYTWRSYFMVYADEDYVELAKARGLPPRMLERRHILRPTLPFIITSFTLSLVGFWQAAIALEVVFEWPGIGLLYVDSLPNFWSESFFPGEMIITIALVVTFAYILGITVLLLEIFYALVDPRVQVDQGPQRGRVLGRRRPVWLGGGTARSARARPSLAERLSLMRQQVAEWPVTLKSWGSGFRRMAGQYVRYPAAVVGLAIIVAMLIGSVYALVALPYSEIGLEWYTDSVTGKTYVPKAAMPSWANWFRREPLLSRLILDSRDPGPEVGRSERVNADGTRTVTITYTFDYEYGQVPQEAFLYFYSDYEARRPFVFWTWTTPGGRVEDLVAMTDPGHLKIALSDFVFSGPSAARRTVDAHPALASFPDDELGLYYLFVDPDDAEHAVNPGTYELQLDAILFEDEAEINAELVLLGQVYGPGGTDGLRRDLIVPLVWGMPFALVFGLIAAFVSVFVALLLGAAAVWYGGLVDWLVQRLSDLNMVLPILAISVVFYAYYGLDIWLVLLIIVVFSSFGSPVKTFRAAFLQVKQAAYIESAKSYGASDRRMVFRYMIPRIMPVLIPQLIYLIPTFVFLEATLGMFNIRMIYPTWGRIIYGALNYGLTYGSRYWVLQPLALVFATGLAFAMVGFALDKILNPKLESA